MDEDQMDVCPPQKLQNGITLVKVSQTPVYLEDAMV